TFLRLALEDAHRQILSLLVQLLAVWASPEVARLVESGLHDSDRRKRASALEALESLSERRFTRLFLPILEAGDSQQEDWREVARRQWSLTTTDIPTLLAMCLQDTNKWVAIGAVLSGQARASMLGKARTEQLDKLADASTDSDVLNTVGRVLRMETFASHQALSLTDIILFLKRIPLYGSITLDQLRTIAASMTERAMSPGEIIFHEGDSNQELYVIVSGKVDIVQHFGATPHARSGDGTSSLCFPTKRCPISPLPPTGCSTTRSCPPRWWWNRPSSTGSSGDGLMPYLQSNAPRFASCIRLTWIRARSLRYSASQRGP